MSLLSSLCSGRNSIQPLINQSALTNQYDFTHIQIYMDGYGTRLFANWYGWILIWCDCETGVQGYCRSYISRSDMLYVYMNVMLTTTNEIRYIEFFQTKNCWGYDEISSKPYFCYMFCSFQSNSEIVCRMSWSSKGTVMVFLAVWMKKRTKTCSASGCLSSSRQEEVKFFNFHNDPVRYVSFNSWYNYFVTCCLVQQKN
jgi:hypothetical protein